MATDISAPVEFDVTISDTGAVEFPFGIEDEAGDPISLAGATITWIGRPTPNSGVTLFSVSTANTITIDGDGSAGTGTATIPAATCALVTQPGVHEFAITLAGGVKKVWGAGRVKLRRGVA